MVRVTNRSAPTIGVRERDTVGRLLGNLTRPRPWTINGDGLQDVRRTSPNRKETVRAFYGLASIVDNDANDVLQFDGGCSIMSISVAIAHSNHYSIAKTPYSHVVKHTLTFQSLAISHPDALLFESTSSQADALPTAS